MNPILNLAHLFLADIESFPNFRLGNTTSLTEHSDLQNIRLGDFTSWLTAKKRLGYSALIHGVIKVIQTSSEKKMIRIAARSVVTFVTNAKSFWNFALAQYERYPMCKHGLVIDLDKSVPVFISSKSPIPAPVWGGNINTLPKLNGSWFTYLHALV